MTMTAGLLLLGIVGLAWAWLVIRADDPRIDYLRERAAHGATREELLDAAWRMDG